MRHKSSLGQNFLKNPGIVDRIIEFSGVGGDDAVLEIGPGTGVLTRALLRHASRVTAVEKDDALFEMLREKFRDEPRLTLMHADILECDLDRLGAGADVVANLPYNIASRVILRLADSAESLKSVVVMVQKEVGLRICASVGQKDYSALSVILGAVFHAAPGFIVGPKNFHPQPKVDSMVIRLIPRERPLPRADREEFKKAVLGAFGQRRKMLRNSLLSIAGITREMLPEIARETGLSLSERPQDLSWEEFSSLSRACRRLAGS